MLSTQGFQIHLHNLAMVCYLEVQYLGWGDEMKQKQKLNNYLVYRCHLNYYSHDWGSGRCINC